MKDKLITVIIPVYNGADSIKIAIESIDSNYAEIIIIDDGSTDDTFKVCKEYEKRYSNVVVYHQENRGPASAREYGIKKATGKYIMFLDSDDYYEKGTIARMIDIIEKYNEPDLIRFRYKRVPDGQIQNEYFSETEKFVKNENFKKEVYPMYLSGYMLNAVWSNCIKREILAGIQLTDTEKKLKFGEDLILSLEIFSRIKDVVFIQDILYRYVYRISSTTHTTDSKKLIQSSKDAIYVYTKLFEYLVKWDMYNLENVQCIRERIKKETDDLLDRLKSIT